LKRVRLLALVACFGLALAAASVSVAASQSGPAKIRLGRTKLGMLVVNHSEFTIYAFTKDRRNHDACQSIRLCLHAWPPVTSAGAPLAGRGVKASLLGTIKLKDGKRQVTYAGHPLYTYIGDTRPRETKFVNILQFNGFWPALNAAGKEVK
jgi:predicted lipoprotein with Yx(FWY)xxD motif